MFVSDLMDSDLTVWMLDHPFLHQLKTDPREDVRNMYNSEKTKFFALSQIPEVRDSNQATIFERFIYENEMTEKIRKAQIPNRRQLDFIVNLLTSGHHLRINDILTESINTCLARAMDSGLVDKIFTKYYMRPGEIAYHIGKEKSRKSHVDLSLDMYYLTFLMFGGMTLASTLVFLGEIWFGKPSKRNKTENGMEQRDPALDKTDEGTNENTTNAGEVGDDARATVQIHDIETIEVVEIHN